MMRFAIVLTLLSAGAFTLQAQPLDRTLRPFHTLRKPSGPPPVRVDDFIRIGPEDSLETTYYIPTSAPPDGFGYPAMVFVHGFGLNKDWDTASAAYWGAEGYVSLCYSVRAHGNSTGTSSIMGPRERSDLSEVIAFVASLPEVNPEKIGIQGGSQGGLHALWAVADSLEVRASTADVITPLWATDMFMNGCYRRTLSFLLTTSTVRYDQERDTLWELLRNDEYEALRTRFGAGRDLDTADFHRSEIPLAYFVKWQDHYFTADDGIESFLRRRGPSKLYAGTGGHYSDDDAGEWTTQWSLIWQWHERFVRGVSNSIELPPDIFYATSSLPVGPDGQFSWMNSETATWPPAGGDSARFYFRADSTLGVDPPGPGEDSVVIQNLWDEVYSFETGFIEGFEGVSFEAAIPTASVIFESVPLPQAMLWVGSPVLRLFLRSEEDRFPLHGRIFEVGSDDIPHLVNRINYSARNWTPGAAQWVEITGIAHAHQFSAGSRIRVEVTNIDRESRPDWGETPFVLPMFKRTGATIYLDSARSASILFPILGEAPLPIVLESFSVAPEGTGVTLRWNTLSEANNYGFFIERGEAPGGEFLTVAFVRPLGGPNSLGRLEYVYRDTLAPPGVSWYRIRQVDLDGAAFTTEPVRVELAEAPQLAVRAAALEQNYPNPFNPATVLRFSLPSVTRARLEVVDITGRVVATLLDGELPAGEHRCVWDASGMAGGVYYARLRAGSSWMIRPMVLIR